MNDILSDLDIQLVNDKSFPIEAKFHKGFYERAQKFLAEFKMEERKYPNLETDQDQEQRQHILVASLDIVPKWFKRVHRAAVMGLCLLNLAGIYW